MILSKDELVKRFRKIEEDFNKNPVKGGNQDLIQVINSHLNALELIKDLEEESSGNKLKIEISNSSEIIKNLSNMINNSINHYFKEKEYSKRL